MSVEINWYRIGMRLRSARLKCHLKQADVAEYLGIHSNSYSNMERGIEPPNLKRIIALCVLYNITPGEVLDDCCPQLQQSVLPHTNSANPELREMIQLLCLCSDEELHTLMQIAQILQKKTTR